MIPMRIDMWINLERVVFAGQPQDNEEEDDEQYVLFLGRHRPTHRYSQIYRGRKGHL